MFIQSYSLNYSSQINTNGFSVSRMRTHTVNVFFKSWVPGCESKRATGTRITRLNVEGHTQGKPVSGKRPNKLIVPVSS